MAEYVVDLNGVETKEAVTGDDRLMALWGLPVRERIVRCRDCEYYRDHEWMLVTDVSDVCHFWADGVKVEPDGFCKWGERKEEQWASPSSRTH